MYMKHKTIKTGSYHRIKKTSLGWHC